MYSVLQVTPSLETGGVERTTIEMAEAISQDGGKALVASRGGRLESELAAAGGELVRMAADSKNLAIVFANSLKLESVARKAKVKVIHARSRAPAWSAYWAAKRLHVPFVTTYHGIYNGKSGLKKYYNSVMARGDIIIANSEYTRAHVIKTHKVSPDRVVTIPRGVDLERFDVENIAHSRVDAVRRGWGATDRFVILLPARLTRWKGHHVLIEAASRLKMRTRERVKVILAGDAQGRTGYAQELEAAISAADLNSDISIVGHITDMPAALAAADVIVTPSIEPEAFGRSAVEAGAMRKIVIASNLGGFAETVEDGKTGFLVPPDDSSALASALEKVMNMPQAEREAMGAAAAARAKALYSKETLQASTLQVYRRLMGEQA
ncbi:MAG: glycosyltransferase family 4 protein [Caulobacterales bacterium]